jgi:hypothetical protein
MEHRCLKYDSMESEASGCKAKVRQSYVNRGGGGEVGATV